MSILQITVEFSLSNTAVFYGFLPQLWLLLEFGFFMNFILRFLACEDFNFIMISVSTWLV